MKPADKKKRIREIPPIIAEIDMSQNATFCFPTIRFVRVWM